MSRELTAIDAADVINIMDKYVNPLDKLDIIRAEEVKRQAYLSNVNELHKGKTINPTEIAFKLGKELNLKFTAPQINNMLIDLGYQTRTANVFEKGLRNYNITQKSVDQLLGITQVIGATTFIRWDKSIIEVLKTELDCI